MSRIFLLFFILLSHSVVFAFGSDVVCMGDDLDSLIETLPEKTCNKGDAIATKHPALFCDFDKEVAFNEYNSAYCIYTGESRLIKMTDGSKMTLKSYLEKTKKK